MKRSRRLVFVALATAVLIAASAFPVAAQGLSACPFARDAILAQTLGPSAHGQVVPNGTGALCLVMGVGDQPMVLTHVANAFADGNPAGADQLAGASPFAAQGIGGSGEITPILGLGDAATFLTGTNADGKSGAILSVQSGTDLYTFTMTNPPDNAQDLLTGLAQAVLANPPQ